MTRAEFHRRIDEQLDSMGFKDRVEVPWGSIMVQMNFEASKEILTVKERETKKVFVGK